MAKLCSACLLGITCRYDSKIKTYVKVLALLEKEVLIPVCPEQLGGQATPRLDAELQGGDGSKVLDNKAKVIESNGNDVTDHFTRGAKEVLKIAQLLNIKATKSLMRFRTNIRRNFF